MKKGIIYIIAILVIILCIYSIYSYTPKTNVKAEFEDVETIDVEQSENALNESLESSTSQIVETSEPAEENMAERRLIENVQFEFEGYSVGKSHIGTFDEWSVHGVYEDDELIGLEAQFNPNSVNTGIEGLDKHLKNEDFFDVENNAEISFQSTSLSEDTISGKLTFLGVTKEITFPVELTDESVSTDFLLDTSPFGMKYTGVNSEVRINFTLNLE